MAEAIGDLERLVQEVLRDSKEILMENRELAIGNSKLDTVGQLTTRVDREGSPHPQLAHDSVLGGDGGGNDDGGQMPTFRGCGGGSGGGGGPILEDKSKFTPRTAEIGKARRSQEEVRESDDTDFCPTRADDQDSLFSQLELQLTVFSMPAKCFRSLSTAIAAPTRSWMACCITRSSR